jgi:N-acetylmuramoyl-L-alanine amidase
MMNVKLISKLFFILLFLISGVSYGENGKKFTVVIDPGHGGRDPGAVGEFIKEKEINLAVALRLGKLIEERHSEDVKVVYTRKRDYFVALDERADLAVKNKANLFISIHTNSHPNITCMGAETYVLGLARTKESLEVAKRENSVILQEEGHEKKYNFDPLPSESYIMFEMVHNTASKKLSHDLASYVQKEMRSNSQRIDRGVEPAGFLVLWKVAMPAVLIELGFISNKEEEEYLMSDRGQQSLAMSIYRAFKAYKHDIDRKTPSISDERETPKPHVADQTKKPDTTTLSKQPESPEPALPNIEPVTPATPSGVVYKIQILTSPKKLPAGSPKLKGYNNVTYYEEKGLYKYIYGEYADMGTATAERNKISTDFRDAFVVAFKDGVRVK